MCINKAVSNVRKNPSFKSNNKELERTYLSSGGKTKSPAIKKTIGKLELGSKGGTTESKTKTTITPRNNAKKGNLQISVSVLTDELLTGRATGEFKTKSFQKLMNRINQKIQIWNVLLNKSALELKEPK